MKTIVVTCIKGGVGKTMLAKELYAYFQRENIPVNLYSLDPQYTQKEQKIEGAAIAVVDTPPAMTPNIHEVIQGASLAIVPVRPSFADAEPFMRTISMIQSAGIPMIVVVNAWNRFRLATAFMTWLKEKPWAQHIITVPQSEAVAIAMAENTSVVEIEPHGKAACAITDLCAMATQIINIK